jgi:hypothetical protein
VISRGARTLAVRAPLLYSGPGSCPRTRVFGTFLFCRPRP